MEPRTARDLRTTPLPDVPCWVEPRLLLKGSISMFAGPAACGKTFMMLELADHLSRGLQLYDHFFVPVPVRVLMIEQEVGQYGMQERLCAKYSQPEDAPADFFIYTKDPEVAVDDPGGFARLLALVEKVAPGVLILDPVTRFMVGGGEEDNTAVARFVRQLDRLLMIRPDLSIIFTHHFRKDPQEPGDSWDDLDMRLARGGSKWGDIADLRVMLRCDQYEGGRPALWRTRWVPRHGPQFDLGLEMGNDFKIRAVQRSGGFGLS